MPDPRADAPKSSPARSEAEDSGARSASYAPQPKPPGVTTFYSFKGGVGRSQALATVGQLLRQRGRAVLLVDFDLEAPGLSLGLLAPEVLRSKLGVAEIVADLSALFLDAVETGQTPFPDLVEHVAGQIAANLHAIPPPADAEESELLQRIRQDFPQLPCRPRRGSLHLLACGRIYDDYAGGTRDLRLPDLLACSFLPDGSGDAAAAAESAERARKAAPLLRAAGFGPEGTRPAHLLQVLVHILHEALLRCPLPDSDQARPPRYVFVDSRAGLADTGSLCVRGLADHLVLLAGLNRQNLAGSRLVMERLGRDRVAPDRLTVVLSPVPEAEIDLIEGRVQQAQVELGLEATPLLLHYHPRLALLEECFVQPAHRHTQLAADYLKLCLHLQGIFGDTWAEHFQLGTRLLDPSVTPAEAHEAADHLVEAALLDPAQAERGIEALRAFAADRGIRSPASAQPFRLLAALHPTSLDAWGTLALALEDRARASWDWGDREQGTALFEEAIALYTRVLQVETEPSRTHSNWGEALGDQAWRLWDAGRREEAEARYAEAFDRYGKALAVKPDMPEALNNWGNDLGELANRLWDAGRREEAEARYAEASDRYGKALALKPDLHAALNNWGSHLGGLAARLWDAGRREEAEARYAEAFDRYAKALAIKPDMHEALYNWGGGLCNLARRLGDVGRQGEAAARFQEARERLLQAEGIRPGAGAFNLACVEALAGNPEPALQWLEKAIRAKPGLAAQARTDPDLISLHSHPRFRALTGFTG